MFGKEEFLCLLGNIQSRHISDKNCNVDQIFCHCNAKDFSLDYYSHIEQILFLSL